MEEIKFQYSVNYNLPILVACNSIICIWSNDVNDFGNIIFIISSIFLQKHFE